MKQKARSMTASELERRFDAGEDVSDQFDWSTARWPNLEAKRVNVDFPAWVVSVSTERHGGSA